MELLEKFPPGMVLSRVAEDLDGHHSHLRVALSTRDVAYEEALTATLNCVRGLPGRILLPTTNPVRRALPKKMALKSQDSLKRLYRRIAISVYPTVYLSGQRRPDRQKVLGRANSRKL